MPTPANCKSGLSASGAIPSQVTNADPLPDSALLSRPFDVSLEARANVIAPAIKAAYPDVLSSSNGYATVRQFAERNPAFSEPSVRNLVFKADSRESSLGTISGNGLLEAGAIIRIGRKVLIHEARFFAWLDSFQFTAEDARQRRPKEEIAARRGAK